MRMSRWGLHWFRRDLRIRGNSALLENCKIHDGKVLGIFCFDPQFLARPDFSTHRFAFFLETLHELREELRKQGGDLLVLDEGPQVAFEKLLLTLKKAGAPTPSLWSWNRDYEPFAISRDTTIERLLHEKHRIETLNERDHLLIEPREIFKDQDPGSFYQVFTPFQKKWLKLLESDAVQERLRFHKQAHRSPLPRFSLSWKELLGDSAHSPDLLETYRKQVGKQVTIPLPAAGEKVAMDAFRRFFGDRLSGYENNRDTPAIDGTSRLSIYFKNGSLTPPQVIAELTPKKHFKFLSELIWREFYYHILFHVPRVEHTAFHTRYAQIQWENRNDFFEAWKAGQTGYPIVDAGMRQLKQTGWMHNRVRMIVASFLTKDLHIDWRWGEQHFMKELLDGDLAPNNGGWQWAASTGCDPQPYFRIFNPTLQGQRFDPQSEYIRRWIPEIDDPHRYPKPIVEHSIRAKQAIELYKKVR